jgi:hypothetical protein
MNAAAEPSSPYTLLGPFVGSYKVLIAGRQVPFLTGEPANGGRVVLHLDERFAVEMSVQDADRIVPFIAHCIAVGMGYTGFPAEPGLEPKKAEPFPKCTELS